MPFVDQPNHMLPPGMPGSEGPPKEGVEWLLYRAERLVDEWGLYLLVAVSVVLLAGIILREHRRETRN